jgi:hypothetical protein
MNATTLKPIAYRLILGIILINLSACVIFNVHPNTPDRSGMNPSQTSVESPLPISTVLFVTTTPLSTPFSTLIPAPSVAKLSLGQYIIYNSLSGLYAISLNGKIQGEYVEGGATNASPDGRRIIITDSNNSYDALYDIQTHTVQSLSFLQDIGCFFSSESPDGINIAVSCKDHELYVVNLMDNSRVLITDTCVNNWIVV